MTVPSDRNEDTFNDCCECGWPNNDCADEHEFAQDCDRLVRSLSRQDMNEEASR